MRKLVEESTQKRIRYSVYFAVAASGLLIIRLFVLQVHYSQKYKMLSDRNRIQVHTEQPARGRIFSSDGVLLATNVARYRVSLRYQSIEKRLQVLEKISHIIDLDDEEMKRIRRQIHYKYKVVAIKERLNWDEFVALSLRLSGVEDVVLERYFYRVYPHAEEIAHIIGYLGRENTQSYEKTIGLAGIEKFHEEILHGFCGYKSHEVNARGHFVRLLEHVPARNGCDIVLSIHYALQKYITHLLSEFPAAGCIVVDTQTYKVLACVSVPTFDSNAMTHGMSAAQWAEVSHNKYKPFSNRVTGSVYPPGSIFKIPVLYAALSSGVCEKDSYVCDGVYIESNDRFHCWKRRGHGVMDMISALRESCDCYFYEIAKRITIDNISRYAEMFGFGKQTGIEISAETCGLMPSRDWKMHKFRKHWVPYETMLIGIGQGAVSATLSQLALMMANVVSGTCGKTLSIVQQYISDACEERSNTFSSEERSIERLNQNHLSIIRQALFEVCNVSGGTAWRSCHSAKYGIAGKTGTSQVKRVGSVEEREVWESLDHAFFVGYAPYHSPRYVVAVVVEHGWSGSRVAAPIARKIFDFLLSENFTTTTVSPTTIRPT